MILVIGGAYQGKLDFVKDEFNISSEDIFFCSVENDYIDFNKKVINSFHLFILSMIKNDKDPILYIKENIEKFSEKIIVCDDISCGIVPVEEDMRILREKIGYSLSIITKKSERVIRVFCGLPMDLKERKNYG